MERNASLFLATLAAILAAGACDGRHPADARNTAPAPRADAWAPPSGLRTGFVVLHPPGRDEVRVRVEFALESEEQRVGLMFRERLDADAGMLFVFPLPEVRHSFFMRNTLVPLDMIFIGDDLQVVGVVEKTEPRTETPRQVSAPSRYVLEVNGGFATEHGVGAGTRVEVVGLDAEPP